MIKGKGKRLLYKILIVSFCIVATVFLVVQTGRTLHIHFTKGEYSVDSWELVWPVIVSTMVAVFGTLVTSYVFLKDTLDRTVDEKGYYARVISEYRQEKVKMLVGYTVMFLGVSCYLILYQSANGNDGHEESLITVFCRRILNRNVNVNSDSFLYAGILMVVIMVGFSICFLYQCINVDSSIRKTAQVILERLDQEAEQKWNGMGGVWKAFIDNYVNEKEAGANLAAFLEVERGTGDSCGANSQRAAGFFDTEKFVIRFSEWEKFILAFLDKSAGFHSGQDTRQRIMIAAGYIEKLWIIQKLEQDDAQANRWDQKAYPAIQGYEQVIERNMNMEAFLNIYQALSDYRDTLQVRQDITFLTQSEKEKENGAVLYLFFLLRFYCSVRCLVTLPKVELFYPAAKLYDVDFYYVRFENCSFRVSACFGVIFARIKMVGSNLALSSFTDCNFYNADMRDCALGNSRFKNCLMREMICSYVDVTGTIFVEDDLRGTTFENAVVVNVEFHKSRLDGMRFIGCKLSGVDFYEIADNDFRYGSFEKSILHEVRFQPTAPSAAEIPPRYRACYTNYFRDLSVSVNAKGIKEREKPDIWDAMDGTFSLDMSSSSFVEAFAEELHFSHMRMDAALFREANLRKAVIKNVCMQGCVMNGVNLTEALFHYVDMESCVLTDAIVYQAQFRLVNIQNSDLVDCHASESAWTCCMLDKSDMSKIDLTKSVMQYVSCRDTILREAELTHAHFTDVIFENCNGPEMLSSYSCFENCNFVNAFLGMSNFNYTIFRGCDMALASLADSTIEEAEFIGCKLENSNFRGCCFIQVTFRNNKNVDEEVFEHCTFIQCRFEGSDRTWEEALRSDPQRYGVRFR